MAGVPRFEQAGSATGPTVSIARDSTTDRDPAAASRRQAASVARSSRGGACTIPTFDSVREAATAKITATQRLERLRAHATAASACETDQRVLTQHAEVTRLTDEAERIGARYQSKSDRGAKKARSLETVEVAENQPTRQCRDRGPRWR